MLQATLFYYPSGGELNDLVYQISGQVTKFFRATDLVAGLHPNPNQLTKLISLFPGDNIPEGLIFIKTSTGILLLTRNNEGFVILIDKVSPYLLNPTDNTARYGNILEVQEVAIPDLSVDDTRKNRYTRKYSFSHDNVINRLRNLKTQQLKLDDFNDPIANILQNTKIQTIGFQELTNKMASSIVNFHIFPYTDSSNNSIGYFIDKNGSIYVVKLNYDNGTNQIFPPL
jgi:hypothetical protein